MSQMRPNLSLRLTEDIRRDIVAGVFLPGQRLKTEALADRYKVSANPVREALWRLQGEGYVVGSPNLGARVRVVDDDFIRNIFELRELIEPLFVRRFCQRASSQDIERFEAAAEAFAKEADLDPTDFYRIDGFNRDFHKIVIEGEVNTEGIQVVERHNDIINAARARLAFTRGRMLSRAREHARIVLAVKNADPDAAAVAAAEHIRNARDDFLEQLRHARGSNLFASSSVSPR